MHQQANVSHFLVVDSVSVHSYLVESRNFDCTTSTTKATSVYWPIDRTKKNGKFCWRVQIQSVRGKSVKVCLYTKLHQMCLASVPLTATRSSWYVAACLFDRFTKQSRPFFCVCVCDVEKPKPTPDTYFHFHLPRCWDCNERWTYNIVNIQY